MVPIKYRQVISSPADNDFFHYWGVGLDGGDNGFTSPQNLRHPSEQSLGHGDRDGNELFVGDYLEIETELMFLRGEIRQKENGQFTCVNQTLFNKQKCIRKIGDKHQNPNLLNKPTKSKYYDNRK